MKVVLVGGARPNFMKIAPILRAMHRLNEAKGRTFFEPFLIHTGQHYDYEMSKIFFEDLGLPEPDMHLGVGSGTHARQTGLVMIELEKVLLEQEPELVIVVGDVNSTLAAALSAVKLHIPIAHVEAGLRSFDKTMPEEINRQLTDAISDYLFTPSPDANQNLEKEGIPKEKIYLVGDIMVDSLLYNREKAEQSLVLSQLELSQWNYAILTLHRPSNVDNKESLRQIIQALREICQRINIVFPAHPRTQKNITKFGFTQLFEDRRTRFIEPLGYLDFLKLMLNARFVMTDSGGIQEETTVLNIPCLTLRNTTERPLTIVQGTNTLVGNNTEKIINEAFKILDGKSKNGTIPKLWDGKTAERIVNIFAEEGEIA